MTEPVDVMKSIANQVGIALETADLTAFSDLLDPDVHWGPLGAEPPTCQNRNQVLSWYRRGKEAGVRAQVVETEVVGDNVVVTLKVTNTKSPESMGNLRWQVLTVSGGRVVNIVGFDVRGEAVAHAVVT